MSEKRFAPWMIPAVILAAVLVAGLLVGLSQLGGGTNDGGKMQDLFSGIPQSGDRLGQADAPVTIQLYEDLQCPACAQFTRDSLAEVVTKHVKTGEVKINAQTLAFIGPDSVPAGMAALAAGKQDRHWQYATLFYLNQGQENSGYVNDKFMTKIARQTQGLDVKKWNQARDNKQLKSDLRDIADQGTKKNVQSTPTLIVSGPNGTQRLVGAVPAGDVTKAIEKVK